MTKEKLNQKEQYYAGTYQAAEEIVTQAKESSFLTKQQITEKNNKFGTYFLVDITYSYNVPKDIMESAAIKNEAERITHEGVEVTNNGDGTFSVDPNQVSIDDVLEESEDTGAEDETVELDVSKDDLPF